jgi:hypothetical protein
VNKIFLSINRNETSSYGKMLSGTLSRAGFAFTESHDPDVDLDSAACSVHLIGKSYEQTVNDLSASAYHFKIARQKAEKDKGFKTFIWLPETLDLSDADERQLEFISYLEHALLDSMVLSKVPSAIQFVEDIKLVLEERPVKKYDTRPAEIFLIYNQRDEKEAERILILLSGILKVEKVCIRQNSGLDHEEFSAQQMQVSRMTVIYHKSAEDWAYPFTQQIWKKSGGASSTSPMLYISEPDSGSSNKPFIAPQVSSFVIPHQLIPLEIKVQFDSLKSKV